MSDFIVSTGDRKFCPIILFHDHQYVQSESGDRHHIHIPCRHSHDFPFISFHKKRIDEMLETNGRFWSDILSTSRESEKLLSPVPSLVSSPTPPLTTRDPPSPFQNHASHSISCHKNEFLDAALQDTQNEVLDHDRNMGSDSDSVQPSHEKPQSPAGQGRVTKKKRRGNLPRSVTDILVCWLTSHRRHPYPTDEQKHALARECHLTVNQISNWFINARRRILRPMLQQELEQHGMSHCGQPRDFYIQRTRKPNIKRTSIRRKGL